MTWISGIPVTPYATDGQVDTFKLSMLIKRLADAGVQNIMAAGNTGEFFSLTTAKVRLVHRTTIKGRYGKSLVSATVGRSLTDAKHAQVMLSLIGADAIMGHDQIDPFAGPSYQAKYFLEPAEASTTPVRAYVVATHCR